MTEKMIKLIEMITSWMYFGYISNCFQLFISSAQYHYCYGYIISVLLLFWLAVITFNVSYISLFSLYYSINIKNMYIWLLLLHLLL